MSDDKELTKKQIDGIQAIIDNANNRFNKSNDNETLKIRFDATERHLQIVRVDSSAPLRKALNDLSRNYSNCIHKMTFSGTDINSEIYEQIASFRVSSLELDDFAPPTQDEFKKLGDMPYLESLHIGHIKALGMEWFSKILEFGSLTPSHGLRELSFDNIEAVTIDTESQISLADCLRKLPSLEVIASGYFELGKDVIEVLERKTQLIHLELRNISEDTIGKLNLSMLKNLKVLKLNYTSGLYDLPNGFSNLEKLEVLDLSNTRIRNLSMRNPSERAVTHTILRGLKQLNIDSTDIEELPGIECRRLELLVISHTSIQEIPQGYLPGSLKKLCVNNCGITVLPKQIQKLEQLELLDMSHTKIRNLPETMSCQHSLTALSIGNTSVFRLPGWISECPNLRYLSLCNIQLASFPKELALKSEWENGSQPAKVEFHDANKEITEDTGVSDGLLHIYVGDLEIIDMDVRILTQGRWEFRKEYFMASDRVPLRRGNIIFLGDVGVGKSEIIMKMLDIDDSFFDDAFGMRFVSDKNLFAAMKAHDTGINADLSNDAEIQIVELSGYCDAQLVHPLFLRRKNLFVIVLDGSNANAVYQRAQYWARFAEAYSPDSTVVFLLNKVKDVNFRPVLLLLRSFTFLKVAKTILRFGEGVDSDEETNSFDTVSTLRNVLSEEITKLAFYTGKIPSGWKNLLRHTELLINSRISVSYKQFNDLCNFYGVLREAGTREDFIRIFAENNGKIFNSANPEGTSDENNVLYDEIWFANCVYRAIVLASHHNGEMSVKSIWESFSDSDMDIEYSMANIRMILKYLAEHDISFVKEETHFIPAFQNMSFGLHADSIPWPDSITLSSYQNHYIMHCPILPQALLNKLACRIARMFSRDGEDSDAFFSVGREGIVVSFPDNNKWRGGTLLIIGYVGSPSELHIYASSAKSGNKSDSTVQSSHLNAYFDFATEPLLSILSQFAEYFANQYTIKIEQTIGDIALPKYIQRTELSLREIAAYKKAGRADYYCGELNRTYNIFDLYRRVIPLSMERNKKTTRA